MDKTYVIEFKDINIEYEDDVEGNLYEALSNVVDFAKKIKIIEMYSKSTKK